MSRQKQALKMLLFKERLNILYVESGEPPVQHFADKIGLARQTVKNFLSGKCQPDSISLAMIAKAFSVSTDWLLGLTDIRTVEPDIISACKYLSLSEEAVKTILRFVSFVLEG